MSNNILPSRPNIGYLKKEAKDLLKAVQTRDRSIIDLVQLSFKYRNLSAPDIFNSDFKLTDSQYILALKYGYTSWNDLTTNINNITGENLSDQDHEKNQKCLLANKYFNQLKYDDLYQRTQFFTLMLAMKAHGIHEFDYSFLMAVSGYSGQFIYDRNDALIWYIDQNSYIQNACDALGLKIEIFNPNSPDEAFEFIHESCSNDLPVFANRVEWGIFTGAMISGNVPIIQFFESAFHNDGIWWNRSSFLKEFWHECGERDSLFVLKGRKKIVDHAKLAKKTLSDIIRFSEEDYWTYQGKDATPKAAFGLNGIKRYADDIRDATKGLKKDENDTTSYFQGAWGCYAIYPQWTARECTSRYLKYAANITVPPVSDHLLEASENYHSSYKSWREWELHLGRSETYGNIDERWADEKHRTAGSDAVLEALEFEKQGIASIKKALKAMNDDRWIKKQERQKDIEITTNDVVSPDEMLQVEIKDMPEVHIACTHFTESAKENPDAFNNILAKLMKWAGPICLDAII